jgi:hypothetical protein
MREKKKAILVIKVGRKSISTGDKWQLVVEKKSNFMKQQNYSDAIK